jgi:endonuclease YncB( thermonuclease family)
MARIVSLTGYRQRARRDPLSGGLSSAAAVAALLGCAILILTFWRPVEPMLVPGAPLLTGTAEIIDGDTIAIGRDRIRLWGIDAPETDQPCRLDGKGWQCGHASASALKRHLAAGAVSCAEQDRDRYGRIVAVCKIGGDSVNAWMVASGWALDYEQYSGGAYAGLQSEAERDRKGLWRGEFIAPWTWRHRPSRAAGS